LLFLLERAGHRRRGREREVREVEQERQLPPLILLRERAVEVVGVDRRGLQQLLPLHLEDVKSQVLLVRLIGLG
jgi:hypothetical protein